MAAISVVIADTGALVSAIKRNEKHHAWASGELKGFTQRIITCEAVISESLFLLKGDSTVQRDLMELLRFGVIEIGFSLSSELGPVDSLMRKYADVPISLADACLVRMSEMERDSAVFTIDSDFRIYRKMRTKRIPLIEPLAN